MRNHRQTSLSPIRFILLTDLHLSDNPGTAAHQALAWAIETINQENPDFLAIAGDMTSFGTRPATACFLTELERIQVPVCLTPGNAERRSDTGLPLLNDWLTPANKHFQQGELSVLLPDTSTGTLPTDERQWLEEMAIAHLAPRRILITHYPLDALKPESAAWLEQWLAAHRVELVAAGHRHIHRHRRLGMSTEFVSRGLDPDKAIGDLPGLSLLQSPRPGEWSERFLPWSPAIELLPADLPRNIHPVGWSIHGDPIDAVRETREFGLCCLELRPRNMDFSRPALTEEITRLRDQAPVYLSYHLPNLAWDEEQNTFKGEEEVRAGLDVALAVGVDSLTAHVPRARSQSMENNGRPTEVYAGFADLFAKLFSDPLRAGVRLAIENIHNPPQTPVDSPALEFATRVDQYLGWIDAVHKAIPNAPAGTIGALFDIGHARNNGGDLDNMQPLSEWYARVGSRILGYHIHQVGLHPETGKPANHQTITQLFGKRISYAGFLWAWSTRQIARAPLFVEVRQAEGRRETASRLKSIFDDDHRIELATDLPDRAMDRIPQDT